jgi:histone deacetylase complex regulatory component SIN3
MLYETDRLREKSTAKEQIIYRIQVERIIGAEQGDHVVRFEWNDALRRLGIQLLNKGDLTIDTASTLEEQWAYYIDSYHMHADTEGVPSDLLSAPYLRRTISSVEGLVEHGLFVHGLQVKLCFNTYKLFYLIHTEDVLVRDSSVRKLDGQKLAYNQDVRFQDGKKWTRHGLATKEAEDVAAAQAAAMPEVVPTPAEQTPPTGEQTQPIEGDISMESTEQVDMSMVEDTVKEEQQDVEMEDV